MLTRRIKAFFREVRMGVDLVVEPKRPEYGTWKYTLGSIKRCPWPEDINIKLTSYTDKYHKDQHYLTCAADGPNPDGSMHHGSIGYWPDFATVEAMDEFARKLIRAVQELRDVTPLLLRSRKDKNKHASWCMGERKKRPKGIDVKEFLG